MKIKKQSKTAAGLRKMKTQLESNIGIYLGATGGGFCLTYAINSGEPIFLVPAYLASAFWIGLSCLTWDEKMWDDRQQAIQSFESNNLLSR